MISCRTDSHALLDTLATDRHVGLHVHTAGHQVHAQVRRAVDRETTRTHVDRHVHTYIMQSCQCSAVHVRVDMHCRSVWEHAQHGIIVRRARNVVAGTEDVGSSNFFRCWHILLSLSD